MATTQTGEDAPYAGSGRNPMNLTCTAAIVREDAEPAAGYKAVRIVIHENGHVPQQSSEWKQLWPPPGQSTNADIQYDDPPNGHHAIKGSGVAIFYKD